MPASSTLSRLALFVGLGIVALALVVVVAAASHRGADDDPADATSETTADEPPLTTPDSLKLAVYERTLSECSTHSRGDLARIYQVENEQEAVLAAVARVWVNRLQAGPDALRSGRDGCRQGFEDSAS